MIYDNWLKNGTFRWSPSFGQGRIRGRRNSSMAVKFAGTMNAINRGLDATKPAKGADMVEDWEAALADLDVTGAKGILRDLASLRKQLEKDAPDADRVHALLHRLGAATTKIADKADTNGEKLKALGEALTEAGEDAPDEEEDTEAAAAPKRARKKA
jgi:uncharacterized protein YmfQ (DUF2313 family)